VAEQPRGGTCVAEGGMQVVAPHRSTFAARRKGSRTRREKRPSHLPGAESRSIENGQAYPDASELAPQVFKVECQHVTDDDPPLEPVDKCSHDLGEYWSTLQHLARDAMDRRRAELGAAGHREQCRPLGFERSLAIDVHDRALDDALGPSVKSRRLEIDHRESNMAPRGSNLGGRSGRNVLTRQSRNRDRHGAKCR